MIHTWILPYRWMIPDTAICPHCQGSGTRCSRWNCNRIRCKWNHGWIHSCKEHILTECWRHSSFMCAFVIMFCHAIFFSWKNHTYVFVFRSADGVVRIAVYMRVCVFVRVFSVPSVRFSIQDEWWRMSEHKKKRKQNRERTKLNKLI